MSILKGKVNTIIKILKQQNKISVLLITYNEIKHISEVISNISFADEIIVVDAFSTDGTFEKLKTFSHVQVIQRKFKNFADQRNFALTKANYNWILFIDADERITQKLRHEILETIKKDSEIVAYKFKRKFFFNSKVIKYSGLQSDTTYRLFKKGHVTYNSSKIVHEYPNINGESGLLKNIMLHYCYTSNKAYKEKMELYATLKAKELFKKGKKPTLWHFLIRPSYKFIINYIIRLGFLDGKEGFNICYLSAYGVWYRYKKLKELTLPKF